MSDRPTPETDAIECKVVFWQMTEHAKKLERQRDAAVEALKRVLARWDEGNKVEWCKSVREDASAVLRDIPVEEEP